MGKAKTSPPYVEISILVHATEDENKVLMAVSNIFPEIYANNIKFKKSYLKGYHKNMIIMLKTSITERTEAMDFLKNLLERLEVNDKIYFSSELENFIDHKKNLYMRFNKQEAFLGKIKLYAEDPIHIKVNLNLLPTLLEEFKSNLNLK